MRWLAALLLAAAPSSTVFTVSPDHRLIEGIASDGKTIWVSSVLDRTIITWRDGKARAWNLPDDVASPLGMAWDDRRKLLWLATDCLDLPLLRPCDQGALIALDRRGRVRRRLAAPGPFHVGDVSARDGQVFVADSKNGAVYRVTGDRLVALVAPGIGRSGQGSALTADGKSLIVADYSQGIARIDLGTGKRDWLPSEGKPLRGIDGMARSGGWYYTIQNGGAVGRLLAFRIVGNSIDVRVVAEGGALADPTQLAATPTAIIVVGESGWATIGKASFQRAKGAEILAFSPIQSQS